MKALLRPISLTKIYDLGRMMDLISVQVRSVHVFLSSGLSEEIERRGLKSGIVSALSIISANPGIAQNQVARSTGIDRTTMVELMDILDQRGWVTREKSSEDRRRYTLYATEEGKKALDDIVAAVEAYEMRMLEGISQDDLEQFLKLLQHLRSACAKVMGRGAG